MFLGYNTNGLAHHDPIQAIDLIHEIGYQSIAITVDHLWLNPFSDSHQSQLAAVKNRLDTHRMKSVIETGARFLLDPKTKHEPTLISANPDGRQRRIDFLKYCIDIAAELNSQCVSLWSGILRDRCDRENALDRLAESLRPVLDHAQACQVDIGFEPEPGMLIDTMSRYETLLEWIQSDRFRLTLDVGHLFCQGEFPIGDYISRYADQIVNVHVEDMRPGVHEHLMFGEGAMDYVPIVQAFREIGYDRALHVELSRHSHEGASAAQKAYDYLRNLL